jgi:2-polyprenyl-6-methoxyphenol hydroxylase-like FAD-dependent oxidoreductase
MAETPILIAGAGPTGLVLALSLAHCGVPFRIIDENSGPGEHSRAMAVHARTLEFYGQFGFADEIVDAGVRTNTVHVHEGGDGAGHEVITVNFKDLGEGISPYPFLLTYPQDDHERFLVDKLKSLGCSIEWGSKLTGFTQDEDGVTASIRHANGVVEEAKASYICGCDGVHSNVRESLAIGFPGGTYDQHFYVADVKIAGGFDRDFNANFGEHTLALMLPVRSSGMQRIIGLVPPELSKKGRELTFEDLRAHIEPIFNIKVTEVNWFSSYRVHHRVAEHFRVGRAFLLGDAGHVHSPVGGQGMNTGIGDAINLGWKLAQVAQGRADKKLLDTYEPERIEFARTLVATTDRAFMPIVSGGLRGELTRRLLLPFFLGVATRFELSRHKLFRALSQTEIQYSASALSEGEAGGVRGGDRLPWLGPGTDDNFAPLRSLDWQLHVYGETALEIVQLCKSLDLPLRQFSWSEFAEKVGLKRDAIYLVRPDGYVALAASEDGARKLAAFAQSFGIRFVLA